MLSEMDHGEEMAEETLTETLVVRMTKDDRKMLQKLSDETSLSQSAVARKSMRIGFGVVEQNPSLLFSAEREPPTARHPTWTRLLDVLLSEGEVDEEVSLDAIADRLRISNQLALSAAIELEHAGLVQKIERGKPLDPIYYFRPKYSSVTTAARKLAGYGIEPGKLIGAK